MLKGTIVELPAMLARLAADVFSTRLDLPGSPVNEGRFLESSITPLRSVVHRRMRYGRLLLGGLLGGGHWHDLLDIAVHVDAEQPDPEA